MLRYVPLVLSLHSRLCFRPISSKIHKANRTSEAVVDLWTPLSCLATDDRRFWLPAVVWFLICRAPTTAVSSEAFI